MPCVGAVFAGSCRDACEPLTRWYITILVYARRTVNAWGKNRYMYQVVVASELLQHIAKCAENGYNGDSSYFDYFAEDYTMTTVTSKDAQNKFGSMLDAARKEPVTITRHDRPVAVVLSPERYAELEKLEDSVWALRARIAAQSGYVGTVETREFIERMLNADSESV